MKSCLKSIMVLNFGLFLKAFVRFQNIVHVSCPLSKWACFFQIKLQSRRVESLVNPPIQFEQCSLSSVWVYLWSVSTFGWKSPGFPHSLCCVLSLTESCRNAGGEACAAYFLRSPLDPAVCLTQPAVHCCADKPCMFFCSCIKKWQGHYLQCNASFKLHISFDVKWMELNMSKLQVIFLCGNPGLNTN